LRERLSASIIAAGKPLPHFVADRMTPLAITCFLGKDSELGTPLGLTIS
jgi:hypothetical protein